MNLQPTRLVTLSVQTPGNVFPITLLNSKLQVIAREVGSLSHEVRPGHYYVARVEAGARFAEKAIRIAAGSSPTLVFLDDELRLLDSAVPVPGSVSRHEYYTHPAAELVNQPPDFSVPGSDSTLVLFCNRFNKDGPKPSWREVVLHRQDGQVYDLGNPAQTPSNIAGYHLALRAGGYFLDWPAEPGSSERIYVPVWLASGWTTVAYCATAGTSVRPFRQTLSFHMFRRGQLFQPFGEADAINTAVELALSSLKTDSSLFPPSLLRLLLGAKFENPMLGILGAHVLLRQSEFNEGLMQEVLGNLERLIPNHPDVGALQILATPASSRESTPQRQFTFPPMVRSALTGLGDAEWVSPPREYLSGLARLARLRLYADGPWTAFAQEEVTFHMQAPQKAFLGPSTATLGRYLTSPEPPDPPEKVAATEAIAELKSFLSRKNKRRDRLRPEEVKWSGLSPREVAAALDVPIAHTSEETESAL